VLRLFVLACLWAVAALAAEEEAGNPGIRTFSPREYSAQNQNWAIQQDQRGLIYVGNGEGVLEFDGVRWRLIPTPNRSVVRSLAMDATGRIYVGAVGEVGYLAPDAQGRMGYVSLNERIDSAHASFADVWKIHPTASGVYFFTRDFIFLLSPSGFRSWQVETPLHLAFSVGERFFVQQMDVGLMEMDGQRLAPIPCGDFFKRDKIYCLLPWDAPPGRGPRLLIGTRRGLYLYDGATVTPFPTEADAFLKEHLLYSGSLLPDGSLALGTLQGGLALLSREGRLKLVLDKHTGLPDASVFALCPDRQGGLWMGLGSGIARLQWPAPFSRFDAASGLEGTVLSVLRHGKVLYAATTQGVYLMEAPDASHRPRFRPVPGIKASTWSLRSMGETILAGNYQGLFEIRNGKATLLQGEGSNAYTLHAPGEEALRIYLGLPSGLASLRRKGPGSPWVKEGTFPGITESVRTIEDAGNGRLWLGTLGREALRVGFPGAGPETPGLPFVERFGAAQGLPVKHGVRVVKVGGSVVFATDQGVFQFLEATRRFQPDPRFAPYFAGTPRRVLVLREDALNRVWMETLEPVSNQHEVVVGTLGADGAYQWERGPFLRFSQTEITEIRPEPGGVVWFGCAEGLFRYDPAVPTDTARSFGAHVRTVLSRRGAVLHGGTPGTGGSPSLKAADNALRFEFSATSFDGDGANLYQIRLDGYDTDWSAWSAITFKEYSYLPEGAYRFRVRARNVFGTVSQEGVWAFAIQPPWHRSWWARVLFLALGAGAVLAGYAALTRFLRARNVSLQRRVTEATVELKQREVKLAAQAAALALANGQLIELNEQKNQFIGIVAHDLRNPLNGILLASEMLEETGAGSAAVLSTARLIQNECRDMDGLIARFLDVAAIEAGRVKAEPAFCSLENLAQQVSARHASRATRKGIRLALDFAPGTPAAFVDPNFAKEIMDNLLSNALKFSPTATTVTLSLRAEAGQVRLTVADQGPGLTAQDQERLYRRFTRLSAAPTGGERSLGLGLSIVKHMVDAMGGRIWVVTEPGAGAAFHVAFPAS
jgi:signal transduction histidine kinase/ligand-binding sensor domain-containing protein